jgi:rRNA-processing protein FCF1
MRLLRNKHARRWLDFYRRAFGLAPPYRVLLDGSFIAAAARRGEVRLERVLPRALLDDRLFLHVTECALAELRALADGGLEGATRALALIAEAVRAAARRRVTCACAVRRRATAFA